MTSPLTGKTIAISISESADLAARGFGPDHLNEALLETARQILLQHGTVAYGGDLRPGGFTEQLVALARDLSQHARLLDEPTRDTDRSAQARIRSYLAWPLYTKMVGVAPAPSVPQPAPADLRARERALRGIVDFIKLPEVTGRRQDLDRFLPPSAPDGPYAWARNLTAMRGRMAADCDAAILMGGKVEGWSGALPGIVEEAVAMLDAGKPIYLLGAFGGAAELVFAALTGGETPALTAAFHSRGRPGYPDLLERLRGPDGRTPMEHAAARLNETGLAGLNNGLSQEENRRLAAARHLPEMLALLLRGLFERLRGG